MNNINASFIDLSQTGGSVDLYSNEKKEALNYFFETSLIYLTKEFTRITFDPLITFMIRRYFYPSYYFNNPSFFIFNINEINDKRNLQNCLNSGNIDDCQSTCSNIKNNINKNAQNDKIVTFSKDDFIILRDLESNAKSSFHLVIHAENFYVCVMKKITNVEDFKHEIEYVSKYSHRCFVKFYGFVKNEDDEIISFIYEYMNNGNLHDYIFDDQFIITPTYSYNAIIRIFQGIDFLHTHSLIHLKLKPENILINHDFLPFISNFESIQKTDDKILAEQPDSDISLFFAPEQYIEKHIFYSSNIYSFGRLIYFLFKKNDFEIISDINSYQNAFLQYNSIEDISENLLYIFQMCIKFKQDERIKREDIKNILLNDSNSLFYIDKTDLEEVDRERFISEIIQCLYENINVGGSSFSSQMFECIFQIFSYLNQLSQSTISSSNEFTIKIPSNLTSIEANKFEGSSILTEVRFKSSSHIKCISSSSFKGCTALTHISIPSSVNYIGSTAFYNCSSMSQIMLPSSVKDIGFSAFELCSSLIQITIPSSLTQISSGTFKNCSSLLQVSIPSSVTEIGRGAFSGCSSLLQVTFPLSVTKIAENAFSNCSSILNIFIPSSVTYIGDGCFSNCSSLAQVIISSSVREINKNTFDGCKSLKYISIPSSVTRFGEDVFNKCTSLEQIIIPTLITKLSNSIFYSCSSLIKIVIPTSVTEIDNFSFYKCILLSEITIPNSITRIGFEAFSKCSSLKQITIPSSVIEMDDRAFSKCNSLEQVTIHSSITKISSGAFSNCHSLEQVSIPSSVTIIDSDAFSKCKSLKQIIIPSSVTKIGSGAFKKCESLTQIEIPSSVTSIENETFQECTSLTQFKIPSSVTSIGTCAFSECTNLIQIEIPSSITEIQDSAFYLCSSLTQISIPPSITEIVETFADCSSLIQITIPSSVTKIGEHAFSNCSSLTQVKFVTPSSVRLIGKYSFLNCSSLTHIIIPSSVKKIENCAFCKCSSLRQVSLYSIATTIEEEAFSECSSLLTLKLIPSSEHKIDEKAFNNCSSFKIKIISSSFVTEDKFNHQFIEEIRYQLKEHPIVDDHKRAILFCSDSFCPIHKGHLKIFDYAAEFLSKEHHIDSILGIISPSSGIYGNLDISYDDRYEMVKMACNEHNSMKEGCLKIVPDNWEGSLIDFLDFQLVFDQIKNIILDEFPNESLLVLFVCGGNFFTKRQCKMRNGFVRISTSEFKIESQTNEERHLYVSNNFCDEQILADITKDNFEYAKDISYDSVVKYLREVVHWI